MLTPGEFIEEYPRLFHMAEHGTWDSIRRHGLLSTTAILDNSTITGDARRAIERQRRPECVTVSTATMGDIVIRDQKPMSDAALSKCLSDMTPAQWYSVLNGRVFFWTSELRLMRLLRARAYRGRAHSVLTVESSGIVKCYQRVIELSGINSGSTIFRPVPRGRTTFARIAEYPIDDFRRRRGRRDAVTEVTIPYAVPDIALHTLSVDHFAGGQLVERLWSRSDTSVRPGFEPRALDGSASV
jgi:hypothetical protein